jgi:hypothetical protein
MRFRKVPVNNKRMDTLDNQWENSLVNMSNKAAKNFVYPDSRLDRKLRSACERKQTNFRSGNGKAFSSAGCKSFMAGPGKKKLLALDTNLLFDLAADKDFAHTFREVYQERGY